MDLLCSSIQVQLGGSVLVNWDHLSEFEPRLPQHDRNVQVIGAFRATHKRSIGRGNIFNQLQFSRVELHPDHFRAIWSAFEWPNQVEEHTGTCTIKIRSNPNDTNSPYEFTLANATVVSAPGRAEQMFSFHTVTIVGGAFSSVTPPPAI